MSTSSEELLFKVAYTTEGAHSMLELLKEFLEFLFFSEHTLTSRGETLKVFIKDKGVSDDGADMLKSLPAAFWETITRENMYEKIDLFSKTFNSLPRIVLYIPKKLPYSEVKKVGEWMHSNVAKNLPGLGFSVIIVLASTASLSTEPSVIVSTEICFVLLTMFIS